MINLSRSKFIDAFVDQCLLSNELPIDLKQQLEVTKDSQSISYNLLVDSHKAMTKISSKVAPLWKFLVSTNIDLPTVKLPERNPELEKRIQKLKSLIATEEYNRMTSNVETLGCQPIGKKIKSGHESSWGKDIRQINRQLIMFLNFVIIVGCAFAAGFKGADYVIPEKNNTFQIKLLSGVFIATVVFFADLYFLLKNLIGAENENSMVH